MTVKLSYRSLAKILHPDRGGSDESMQALNELYEAACHNNAIGYPSSFTDDDRRAAKSTPREPPYQRRASASVYTRSAPHDDDRSYRANVGQPPDRIVAFYHWMKQYYARDEMLEMTHDQDALEDLYSEWLSL